MAQRPPSKKARITGKKMPSRLKKPSVHAKKLQNIRQTSARRSTAAPAKTASSMRGKDADTSARINPFPTGLVAWATSEHFETWWPCRVVDESTFSAEERAHEDFPAPSKSTRIVKPFYDETSIYLVRTTDMREYAAHAERMLRRAPPQCALPLLHAHIEALQFISVAGNESQRRRIKDAGGLQELLLTLKRPHRPHLSDSASQPPPASKLGKTGDTPPSAPQPRVLKWGVPRAPSAGDVSPDRLAILKARAQLPRRCAASPDELSISLNTLAPSAESAIAVDRRLSVFSSADMAWISGRVTRLDRKPAHLCVRLAADDGDVVYDIANIRELRWRPMRSPSATPRVSYIVSARARSSFTASLVRAKRASSGGQPSKPVAAGDICTKAADFLFLEKGDQWLSDALILNFGRSLLFDAVHATDRRVCLLDPALGTLAGGEVAPSLPTGVSPADVDIILWPVNDAKRAHWLLVVAETDTRSVCALDPQTPMRGGGESAAFVDGIVEGLRAMTSEYDERYGVQRRWEVASPRKWATELNLPPQPPGDITNCGVLVCMYMWAIIVGMPCPLTKMPFGEMMMTVRTIIGGRLGEARYKKDRQKK